MVNLWVWSYELKSRMDEGRKTDRPRCPRIFQILEQLGIQHAQWLGWRPPRGAG